MSKLQDDYDALKRLHDSTNAAVTILEERMNLILGENARLKADIENADKRVAIQKQIVIDNLRMTQDEKDKLVQEILGLRKIIKGLRGE